MSMIGKIVHYYASSMREACQYPSGRVVEEYFLENCSKPSQKIHMLVLDNGKEISLEHAYLKTVVPQSPLPNVQ
jgi:hypothetical protein